MPPPERCICDLDLWPLNVLSSFVSNCNIVGNLATISQAAYKILCPWTDFWPHMVSLWPWPLTFWPQNLISSSLSSTASKLGWWVRPRRHHGDNIITLSLESASHGTSPAYSSWRLITLIWSHTRQFVISFITTVTIHYSLSLPLQAQNSSFPQILSSIVRLTFHPPDWLHTLQLFFVFLRHVGFNYGTVCAR